MKYITYGLMLLWSVLRGWASMPRAICLAFKSGGIFRWLGLTLTGFRYHWKSLPAYTKDIQGDKIHFLNTSNSDALLLESGGLFALIDAGEDSDYPAAKRFLAYPGWEEYVVDYVKRAAGDARGKVSLEFVLGTHAHSDHIGGFDTLILDPDITIGKAYLKPYDSAHMQGYEREYWDNEEVHGQMTQALAARGVPWVRDIPAEAFALGNFRVSFFNRGQRRSGDANDESIGVLVERGGRRAFLAGDINNISGAEREIAKEVGPVDLLKAGHHGHEGSSTLAIVTGLRPETVVFAKKGKAFPTVCGRFLCAGGRQLLGTGMLGGVMAVFHDEKIEYYAMNEFAEPVPPKGY